MTKLSVNRKQYEVDADPNTPLLWVIRDDIGLTGTKFGCGVAQCGACTVHVDGSAKRSCVTPMKAAIGKEITTIEGISPDTTHALQKAWLEVDVPQCGYCQSGQIMSAAILLQENSKPTDTDIDHAMSGIICRCGTYNRIRDAIKKLREHKHDRAPLSRVAIKSTGLMFANTLVELSACCSCVVGAIRTSQDVQPSGHVRASSFETRSFGPLLRMRI